MYAMPDLVRDHTLAAPSVKAVATPRPAIPGRESRYPMIATSRSYTPGQSCIHRAQLGMLFVILFAYSPHRQRQARHDFVVGVLGRPCPSSLKLRWQPVDHRVSRRLECCSRCWRFRVLLGSHSRDQHRSPAHVSIAQQVRAGCPRTSSWGAMDAAASEYRTHARHRPARGMQYLSLMIGSSDMPLDALGGNGAPPMLQVHCLARRRVLWDGSTNWPMLGACWRTTGC